MAFASATDFATLVNRTLSDAEEAQIGLLLDLATSAIQGYTNQTIEKVTADVVKLEGTWGPDLELPERPVLAVSSVKVNNQPVVAGVWQWNGRQLIRQGGPLAFDSPPGFDWSIVVNGPTGVIVGWGGPAATVEVTYDHGYEDIPEAIRLVCLSIAMRFQAIYASGADLSAGFVLTDSDKAVLRQYKRWWN